MVEVQVEEVEEAAEDSKEMGKSMLMTMKERNKMKIIRTESLKREQDKTDQERKDNTIKSSKTSRERRNPKRTVNLLMSQRRQSLSSSQMLSSYTNLKLKFSLMDGEMVPTFSDNKVFLSLFNIKS